MNKKQWIALGVMFMLFATLESYAVTGYEMVAITGEDIALIIHDAIYSFLMWVCFIAAVACFICAWLEKEGAR